MALLSFNLVELQQRDEAWAEASKDSKNVKAFTCGMRGMIA